MSNNSKIAIVILAIRVAIATRVILITVTSVLITSVVSTAIIVAVAIVTADSVPQTQTLNSKPTSPWGHRDCMMGCNRPVAMTSWQVALTYPSYSPEGLKFSRHA